MAHPGQYPNMPQMMGQGPMGPQGPMMAPPGMRPPMRRGTSKAVPVVVSAGLAVGVFCGLLFGLGTGTGEAAPSKGNNVKAQKDDEASPTTPTPAAKPVVKPTVAPTIAAKGSGSATPTVAAGPTVKMSKLTVKIAPEAAATAAKVQIDGKDIDGLTIDLPTEKKTVKVGVSAPGYHSFDKKVDLVGDEATITVDVELVKRGGGGGGGSPGFGGASRPGSGDSHPTAPGTGKGSATKKPPKGGGLIDL